MYAYYSVDTLRDTNIIRQLFIVVYRIHKHDSGTIPTEMTDMDWL